MKLNNENTNSIKTNAVKSINFEMGDSSVIAGILQDKLYQYKLRTMVQEYLCNARDAHRENGNKMPFEVTLPTAINPVLTIADYGPGLSPERIIEVFTKYGESTKRSDNKQTGGFGIGSKSGWAYTDQFTVVSRFNGVKTTYSAHKGISKLGQLTELESISTDESNGVTIIIPIKSQNFKETEEAVFRCLHFWKESELPLVNGFKFKRPTYEHKSLNINENVTVIDAFPQYLFNGYDKHNIIVVDGIPYPLNYVDKLTNGRYYISRLFFEVPTGLVSVSANRESIDDNEQNKKVLSVIFKKFESDYQKMIENDRNQVKDLSSLSEFYLKYYKFNVLDNNSLNFKQFSKSFTVSFDWSGNININLPSTNTITSYFQSYRNKQTKSKEIGNIKLNTIDKIYVTKKSDIYDKRRIEQNYNRSTIYVINNNNEALDDLKLLIGADKFVDIETLPFTKPVRQLKTKQNLLADQVSIYFLEGTKLQKNVVLSDLIKKDCTYVYCSLDFYHNTRFDFNLLHYWVSKFRTSEYKFISGTQQFLNDIKKNKIQNFISFDEWLENYSLNKEEIAEIKSHNFKNRSNANTAIYLVQLLKELGLYDVSYIKNGNSEDLSIKIPQFLLTKFKNDSKLNAESDIKSVASIVGALPLLKEFRPGLSKIAKDELMIYIDAKLPKKGNN